MSTLFVPLNAQDDNLVLKDSIALIPQQSMDTLKIQKEPRQTTSSIVIKDTLTDRDAVKLQQSALLAVKEFKPNPTKAVIYSAIFPGLGQIYNRKYWKLPIVYGGFMGVVYAVTWNGNMYSDYKKAYRGIMIEPERNMAAWQSFVPGYMTPKQILENRSEMDRLSGFLKRRRDYFRRNRDLAILVGVGLYALCMIDAYVDAQLYDFEISPGLSFTVAPTFYAPSQTSSAAVGLQCNIYF